MAAPRSSQSAHVQVLAIAWNFGWPIASGVLAGYWIDRNLGCSPVATLGLGVGAMTVSVWRLIELGRREAAEAAEAAGETETPTEPDPDAP